MYPASILHVHAMMNSFKEHILASVWHQSSKNNLNRCYCCFCSKEVCACIWESYYCISLIKGPGLYFLQRSLPWASIRDWPQIGARSLIFLYQWKEKVRTLGMIPFPNAVSHTSHRRCAIPDVLSVSSARAEMTPNSSSDKSCPSGTWLRWACPNQCVAIGHQIPYLRYPKSQTSQNLPTSA